MEFAVSLFHLQQTNANCHFLLVPFSVFTYIRKKELYIHICTVSNGKLKPRQFILIRSPFFHRANGILLFVCLLLKKQTEVIHYKRTNGLNGLNGLAYICHLYSLWNAFYVILWSVHVCFPSKIYFFPNLRQITGLTVKEYV